MSRVSAAALVAASALGLACGGSPGGSPADASRADQRGQGGRYVQRNLVSDGSVQAEHVDPNLINAWGLARLPASPWWVAAADAGVSTLYDGEGVASPLVVSVSGAGGQPGAPTGTVANPTDAFVVTSGGASGAARFLFASEDGTISGWNPQVPPPAAGARSTTTVVAVDRSADEASYKGLALAQTASGPRLYAADFKHARVDVFDGAFAPVSLHDGAFVDPDLPAGFAPFGVHEVNGHVVVTYAMQDEEGEEEVAGPHLGYVDAYTTDGHLERRIASGGKLDAPWGVALAPQAGFGRLSGRLLVGNFGDGTIVAYKLDGRGHSDGGDYLTTADGRLVIDGLWGLGFGNGAAAGPVDALYFAAGPEEETHGLFGRIDFAAAPGDGDGDR
ncbi:MAG: TIGR03118 family protein [Anaeromyxobacter sp.]